MRRGDDHAGIELLRTCEVSNTRSGNHARAADFHTTRTQSERNPVGDPTAGFSRVLSNNDARLRLGLDQIMSKSAPDQKSTFGAERKLARHAANTVGSEKLPGLRCHCDWGGADVSGARSMITVIRTGWGSATWTSGSET